MSSRIAVVIAVILGMVAAFAVHRYMREEEQQLKERHPSVLVVVASRPLKKGDIFRNNTGEEGMIRYKEFPKKSIVSGMMSIPEANQYDGFVLTKDVEPGSAILTDMLKVSAEQDVGGESYVEKGHRAVTIAVNMESGAAGLLRPGDHVDVIATFDLGRGTRRTQEAGAMGVKTLHLLQNVRVIALDNQTETTGRTARSGRNYRTVTLSVTPHDALRLTNAEEQGRIRLLLRNRSDTEVQPEAVVRDGKRVPYGYDVVANELEDVAPHTNLGDDDEG
jgi:pilus assembly protein CpaB